MITGITHLTMEGERAHVLRLAAGMGFAPRVVDDVELPAGFEDPDDAEGVLPLAVLEAARGMRLEVVTHSRSTGRRGAWGGVFAGPPPVGAGRVVARPELAERLRRAGVLGDPVCVELDVGGARDLPPAEAWFGTSGHGDEDDGDGGCGSAAGGGLAGILGRTADVAAEVAFWSAFARVRWDEVGIDAAYGRAPLPMPRQTCAVVLVRDEARTEPFAMNDAGFPSLGVHSTAVDRDCATAVAAGAAMWADSVVTSVGGQAVRMALVATPGGAPVELLGVERAKAAR